MKNLILSVSVCLLLFSCEQEEAPVSVAVTDTIDQGGVIDRTLQSTSLAFEPGYANQMYFSLKENIIVQENQKEIYDFKFETSVSGSHVYLNSSLYMGALSFPNKAFDELSFSESSDWGYDSPKGTLDDLAINLAKSEVFLVFGGYDLEGNIKPTIKLEVKHDKESYQVKCQREGGSTKTYTVPKAVASWTHLSVDEGLRYIEPSEYAILFSQYTHIYDDGTSYLVTGALIDNEYQNVSVALLEEEDFEEIVLSDVEGLVYSKNNDAIGFEWKSYSIENQMYTMQPQKVYVIKKGAIYFKLRFVGFNKNVSGGRDMIFEHARL